MGLRQTLVKVGPKVYCPESLLLCSPNFRKPLREYLVESLAVEMSVSPGCVSEATGPTGLQVEEEPLLQGGHPAPGGLRSLQPL